MNLPRVDLQKCEKEQERWPRHDLDQPAFLDRLFVDMDTSQDLEMEKLHYLTLPSTQLNSEELDKLPRDCYSVSINPLPSKSASPILDHVLSHKITVIIDMPPIVFL